MISTVRFSRVTTAQVAFEHPDEWTPAEVEAAAKNRAIDLAGRADFWCADTTTTLTGVEVGVDFREVEEPEPVEAPEPPELLELTEDDL